MKTTEATPSVYERMASINVNDHVEKKQNLSYLSWAWAVDQLLRQDPNANWSYQFFDSKPFCNVADTAMVFCTVKAFGIERTAQLPVMNHRNQAIANPNSFELNTAMQRCLAKAIALHGLGLYIYAGEDLPLGEEDEASGNTANTKQPQSVSSKATGQAVTAPPASSDEVQKLGDQELKTIRELASKVGVNELVIAKAYKVERLEDVPLAKTANIVKKLQEKAAEQTQPQTTE